MPKTGIIYIDDKQGNCVLTVRYENGSEMRRYLQRFLSKDYFLSPEVFHVLEGCSVRVVPDIDVSFEPAASGTISAYYKSYKAYLLQERQYTTPAGREAAIKQLIGTWGSRISYIHITPNADPKMVKPNGKNAVGNVVLML
jgi:hypothetical protein